jgi:hypothetical protein
MTLLSEAPVYRLGNERHEPLNQAALRWDAPKPKPEPRTLGEPLWTLRRGPDHVSAELRDNGGVWGPLEFPGFSGDAIDEVCEPLRSSRDSVRPALTMTRIREHWHPRFFHSGGQ